MMMNERMMEVVSSDNWSCKTHKAPIKSPPPTNRHRTFYRPDAFLSPKATKEKSIIFDVLLTPSSSGVFPTCL